MNIDADILSIAFKSKTLCCRCSTCVGVCPHDALSVGRKDLFPVIAPDKCVQCGICKQTCPGGRVNFRDLTQLTFGHEHLSASFDGHVQRVLVGQAVDPGILNRGAGGGVITALMWGLLKDRHVDGCIVTRMDRKRPWKGETVIARTYKDLLSSQGSHYLIVPVNHIIKQLRALSGKYAIAALPCQVHGLRLACQKYPVLKKKIKVIIGLYCGGPLEAFVVTEMLKIKGLKRKDLENFQFRGGEWPGRMRVILKSGRTINMHYSNYKDGAYNYLIRLCTPKRCQMCIDGSNEFADIAVGDAWTRNKQGEYQYKRHSRILVRTLAGQKVIQTTVENHALKVKDVSRDPSYQTHKLQTQRKGINAPLRVARYLKAGRLAPEYDRGISDATPKEKLDERIASFFLWIGQYRFFRYPLLKFLLSDLSVPLIQFRLKMKNRKYLKMR